MASQHSCLFNSLWSPYINMDVWVLLPFHFFFNIGILSMLIQKNITRTVVGMLLFGVSYSVRQNSSGLLRCHNATKYPLMSISLAPQKTGACKRSCARRYVNISRTNHRLHCLILKNLRFYLSFGSDSISKNHERCRFTHA